MPRDLHQASPASLGEFVRVERTRRSDITITPQASVRAHGDEDVRIQTPIEDRRTSMLQAHEPSYLGIARHEGSRPS